MRRLEARPLAVHLAPGVREVTKDVLDAAAPGDLDLALARPLQSQEQLVLDLEVPGEVVLAGLDHGPRGRYRVAAALHLHPIKERPVPLVIAGEDLAANDVTRLELDTAIGAGPHGREIGRRLS